MIQATKTTDHWQPVLDDIGRLTDSLTHQMDVCGDLTESQVKDICDAQMKLLEATVLIQRVRQRISI